MVAQEGGIDFSASYPKANILNRFIAKFLDFLVVSAIGQIPLQSSYLAALSYLLLSDGFSGGRSLGKQLIGLQAVVSDHQKAVTFRESVIRNFPLGIGFLLMETPWIGWFLGFCVLGFESLLLIGNPRGNRFGDELAGTQVIEQKDTESLEKERGVHGADK
ncbi:MAG: RDD family protein [Nitrospiria bacterium]